MIDQNHTALYRKYRPAGWGEVLGQEHVVSVLKRAAKDKTHTHAYLFSGTRGTGKTSVARILARELGVSANDMHEIDAASNRGIDDVRELREAVNMLPLESPYKVYIIDEVHMLTKEAFNALLKTLEEPPSHVIFVLATTEAHKLPDTIISRCETHTFKKPSHEILKRMIADVAKREGKPVDSPSADLIALLGDGSYRDTLGILQKVFSIENDEITLEHVTAITGAPPAELVNDVLHAVAEEDAPKGLSAIGKAATQNIDMALFTKLILRKLRAVILLRFAPKMKETLADNFTTEDMKQIEEWAKTAKTLNSATLQAFLSAYQELSYAHIPQIPLELALIKLLGEEDK